MLEARHKLTVIARKIKAKITGNKPCSFETRHGHNFKRVGEIKGYKPFQFARFDCTVCGQKAMYEQFRNGFELLN